MSDTEEKQVAQGVLEHPEPYQDEDSEDFFGVDRIAEGVKTDVVTTIGDVLPDLEKFEEFEFKPIAFKRFGLAHLGHFLLKRVLTRGGQGVLYEAIDENLGRKVIIKTLISKDPDSTQRFLKEMRTMAKFSDKGTAFIYTAGKYTDIENRTGVFYVMPRYEGNILSKTNEIREKSPQKLLQYLKEHVPPLIKSIQRMHEHHIMHRDIKPENILYDKSGVLKLTDFGITQDWVQGNVQREMDGSLPYMAPEMALTLDKDVEINESLDWYGLGATLYRLLTGLYVFEGEDEDIIIAQLQTYADNQEYQLETKSRLREVLGYKKIPGHLSNWILMLLDADPDKRIPPEGVLESFSRAIQSDEKFLSTSGYIWGKIQRILN